MRFNFAYVKQHPFAFGIGALVLFILIYFVASKGAPASSGGVTVQNAGPSDAMVMAGAQIQMAQIQAGAQMGAYSLQAAALERQGEIDLAKYHLESTVAAAALAANERMAERDTSASLAAMQAQIAGTLAITEANNDFQIGYAQVAANTAAEQIRASLGMVAINAQLQRDLGEQQTRAFMADKAFDQIQFMKKRDRDDTTRALTSIFGNGGGPSYATYLPAPTPANRPAPMIGANPSPGS